MVNLWMEKTPNEFLPYNSYKCFHFLVKQCNSYAYPVKVDLYHNILHKTHILEATPVMMLPLQ